MTTMWETYRRGKEPKKKLLSSIDNSGPSSTIGRLSTLVFFLVKFPNPLKLSSAWSAVIQTKKKNKSWGPSLFSKRYCTSYKLPFDIYCCCFVSNRHFFFLLKFIFIKLIIFQSYWWKCHVCVTSFHVKTKLSHIKINFVYSNIILMEFFKLLPRGSLLLFSILLATSEETIRDTHDYQ